MTTATAVAAPSITTTAAQASPIVRPAQTVWLPATAKAHPSASTSGTGQIQQYRNGSLIATYSTWSSTPDADVPDDGTALTNPNIAAETGAGAFTAYHSFSMMMEGDRFVARGYFTGPFNQPYLGQSDDSAANAANGVPRRTPTNIEIVGELFAGCTPAIYVNEPCSDNTFGQGALYFGACSGVTWSGIDILGGPMVSSGKGGIYINGAHDLTITRSRVSGFMANQANTGGATGIFGTLNNTGTLAILFCELDHNGGPNGPMHNLYISASLTDPLFTLLLENNFSHDAFYGHLAKSRAQRTIAKANYFMGGVPQLGVPQAENYGLDICNGGVAIVHGNVFVKNASGPNSNGMCLTYGMEGFPTNEVDANGKPYTRTAQISIENNTFVSFADTYDGEHANFPISILYPQVVPGPAGIPKTANAPAIPADRILIARNAFVGFPVTGNPVTDYRGDEAVIAAFSEMSQDFRLSGSASVASVTDSTVGRRTYSHERGAGPARKLTTIGAFD